MLNLQNKPSESDQSSCSSNIGRPIISIDPAKMPQQDSVDIFRTIAGIAGNVLEWYDFALFGFFGDVIADVFFPKQSGHSALIESYAVFGAAFIVRPCKYTYKLITLNSYYQIQNASLCNNQCT